MLSTKNLAKWERTYVESMVILLKRTNYNKCKITIQYLTLYIMMQEFMSY